MKCRGIFFRAPQSSVFQAESGLGEDDLANHIRLKMNELSENIIKSKMTTYILSCLQKNMTNLQHP